MSLIITSAQATEWVGQFYWPLTRIGALMIAAPVFSNRSFTLPMRILLSVALTILVMPLIKHIPSVEILSLEGVLISMQQVLIGVAMGFVVTMVMQVVVIGGESIAFKMGLGFAHMADPQNGVSVPLISQFLVIITTLIFISIGGHLMLLQLLYYSFESLPIGPIGITLDHCWMIVSWASQMFAGAFLLALPAITMLLLINLALGVMTRAAPTLNIFSVGFPVTLMAGMGIILVIVLPSLNLRMQGYFTDAFSLVRQILAIS